MAILDLPLLGLMKQRMNWQQARQKQLAENVANADSPTYKPKDLKQPSFVAMLRGSGVVARTNEAHMSLEGTTGSVSVNALRYETTPSGNSVVLEDEMQKMSENVHDHQTISMLYQKSFQLIKAAVGKN
jgi:flagellar basal-body rod protein FlgB